METSVFQFQICEIFEIEQRAIAFSHEVTHEVTGLATLMNTYKSLLLSWVFKYFYTFANIFFFSLEVHNAICVSVLRTMPPPIAIFFLLLEGHKKQCVCTRSIQKYMAAIASIQKIVFFCDLNTSLLRIFAISS